MDLKVRHAKYEKWKMIAFGGMKMSTKFQFGCQKENLTKTKMATYGRHNGFYKNMKNGSDSPYGNEKSQQISNGSVK
jgi:hypothetical protein